MLHACFSVLRYIPLAFVLFTSASMATAAEQISFHSPNAFDVHNRSLSIENGTIYLDAAENDGVAWLKGVRFVNGRISIDVKGADRMGRSFVGLAFRASTDQKHCDLIYVRPFNFQNADVQRRARALQYMALPDHPWELLRERFPGKYEAAITPAPNPEDWVRLTIDVRDDQARVYVNDHASPALSVDLLNTSTGDAIALWVGNNSDGSFRNLRIEPAE